MSAPIIPVEFDFICGKLRDFFHLKGLVECYVQNRLQILAACEDPATVADFTYSGENWPLPQTGQMHLETMITKEIERNPDFKGFFCITTSYRQEPNPIPGRHDLIFPMIEYEIPGDLTSLENFERDMLEFLGFGKAESFPSADYLELCKKYNTRELTHLHEKQLYDDFGSVFFIKNFPEWTSPFWNMKRVETNQGMISKKIDVILCGIETFGSAERSCDTDIMKQRFHTISEGMYANLLFSRFGRERVLKELDTFLSEKFVVRSGCGIGYTRLAKAMRSCKLLPLESCSRQRPASFV